MARILDLSRSWKYFAGYFLLALVAFWPTYLSQPRASSFYTHLHAFTATAWMLLLIMQSWAIGERRVGLHRASGKASYVLAPSVVLSILLLAHDRIRGASGKPMPSRLTSSTFSCRLRCFSRCLSVSRS